MKSYVSIPLYRMLNSRSIKYSKCLQVYHQKEIKPFLLIYSLIFVCNPTYKLVWPRIKTLKLLAEYKIKFDRPPRLKNSLKLNYSSRKSSLQTDTNRDLDNT